MNYDELTDEDCREIELNDHKNKVVKHFKGDYYIIVDIAEHTETGEKMVVYRALYGKCKLYVRPMKMFLEECSKEQFDKYGQKYRLEFVEFVSRKE